MLLTFLENGESVGYTEPTSLHIYQGDALLSRAWMKTYFLSCSVNQRLAITVKPKCCFLNLVWQGPIIVWYVT